jgi:hypothetical protein
MSVVSVVCFQVEVPAWSLIQRSPTLCGVSECYREVWTGTKPWTSRSCCSMGGGGDASFLLFCYLELLTCNAICKNAKM